MLIDKMRAVVGIRLIAVMSAIVGACMASGDEHESMWTRGTESQKDMRGDTWPDDVRLTAWVPIIDTLCDKTFQMYVTLEPIDCEAYKIGPGLASWAIGLRPFGYAREWYSLVLDPLKEQDNTECKRHFASREWHALSDLWQLTDAYAVADEHQLRLLGALGESSLRFSTYNASPDVSVTYQRHESGEVEVNVGGLAQVPTTGALVDNVVQRSLQAELQVQTGLMHEWVDLNYQTNGSGGTGVFLAEDVGDGIPQGIQMRVQYAIHSIESDTILQTDENGEAQMVAVPRVAINVIRYVDRPFDASSVDCTP